MQVIYNIAGILLVILAMPVFFVRALREKGFVERMKQSFGFLPPDEVEAVAQKGCIWVHAASVGEIVAASPLIKEFKLEFPERPILVSVVTSSGYEMAKRIVKDAESIIYFPLDLPWLSSRVVKRIMPSVFLPVETELWPNFLKAARENRIAVMMVNGRISDKSVKRYHHLRGLLKDMIGSVNKFCMQSPIDAKYIIKLGANPDLVMVTGNTKFDQTYTNVSDIEKAQLLQSMGLDDAEGILLAGSTHKGEEEFILASFQQLKREFPKIKLVIAPREIMRAEEIVRMAKSFGVTAETRTGLSRQLKTGHDAVILDTIGELGKVYSIGDVVYVGGSMVLHGGHNILEPAAHGKAIIVGGNMFNFKDTHALFTARRACITVKDSRDLSENITMLFKDQEKRRAMEAETLRIVKENRGAARKSAIELRSLINELDAKEEKLKIHSNAKIENIQTYLYQLVHGEVNGRLDGVVIGALYIFSFIYCQLLELKLFLYRIRFLKKYRLGCHVISLGNITVGGTGKTPTAQRLAASIRDMGYKVVILNRGYRAKWKGDVGVVSDGQKIHMTATEAGDEAFLLAKNLPGIPVLIGPDRAVTGQYAVESLGAQVVILDDGYQHWRLERNLDIVLIDAINVFGNDYMLPRGTLREPVSHLDRADVCLLTKVDQAQEESIIRIRQTIRENNGRALIVESVHSPKCFIEIGDWYRDVPVKNIDVEKLRDKKVVAVSAIGNPASFEQTIHDIGAALIESIRFPDHHDYTTEEMQEVVAKSSMQGAEAIIITAKDAVKIPPAIIMAERPLPVYVLSIEVDFKDGAEGFMKLVENSLKKNCP